MPAMVKITAKVRVMDCWMKFMGGNPFAYVLLCVADLSKYM